MIPNKRKSSTFPLDDLKINKSISICGYSAENSKKIGSKIAYYNKTRNPKRFVQRKIKNLIVIFREK
jgi:hypothetical protein